MFLGCVYVITCSRICTMLKVHHANVVTFDMSNNFACMTCFMWLINEDAMQIRACIFCRTIACKGVVGNLIMQHSENYGMYFTRRELQHGVNRHCCQRGKACRINSIQYYLFFKQKRRMSAVSAKQQLHPTCQSFGFHFPVASCLRKSSTWSPKLWNHQCLDRSA